MSDWVVFWKESGSGYRSGSWVEANNESEAIESAVRQVRPPANVLAQAFPFEPLKAKMVEVNMQVDIPADGHNSA